VQILCPIGGEEAARRFYGEAMGLREIEKPPTLSRDGVWFALGGGAELHIGARREDDEPTRNRSHFAVVVDDMASMTERLTRAGATTAAAPHAPGWKRIYVADPFGNRLELIELV
jgi:catechol 2,3-dioxygenase-like lactoylglutathione lyase family enzyme